MIPAPPKSLAQLEAQHAQFHQQLRSWQELATTWATERGMELDSPPTAEEFFAWLAQEVRDEALEALERE